MTQITLSAQNPALYVSEGFVEAMHHWDINDLAPNQSDIRDVLHTAHTPSLTHLGGIALRTSREFGSRTDYYLLTEPDNDRKAAVDANSQVRWKDIHEAGADDGYDVLRLKRALPTEMQMSDALYKAAVSYHGRESWRPAPLEVFGTLAGGGLGTAVPIIELLGGDQTGDLDPARFGTFVVGGLAVGATAIQAALKGGKRHFDKNTVDLKRPIQVSYAPTAW